MKIEPKQRPWMKKVKQGNRYSPDPHYQSSGWKRTRAAFRLGFTEHQGFKVPNINCIECFKETGRFVPGANLDHFIRRKDGGTDEFSNLQTLCDKHHARKSAFEQQESMKNKKQPGK